MSAQRKWYDFINGDDDSLSNDHSPVTRAYDDRTPINP
jgi:hypothetical protein